ncbi:MAG TPA: hypothetical protein VKQ05_11860 [Gemmatimonadales bacterium]|nr:hypothetical protein [Gemmatimonadales bacterium]
MRPFAVTIALLCPVTLSTPLAAQRGRDCRPTYTPDQLPVASAIVDSAHALTDLAAFSRSDRPMLFSLVFNEDDSLPSVRPLDKTDAIAAVFVLRALRPQPPSEKWAVRMRVQGGANPALTIERSIYCPPEPDSTPVFFNPNITRTDLQNAGIRSGVLRIDGYDVLVSDEGRAVAVKLIGSTGVKALDDQLTRELKELRFHPALLDDQPVQAVFRVGGDSPRP